MLYALLQNLRSEISHKGLNSVELLFTLLRTLIPTLEHKTVLSFQVTHNKNQTGNRLRFLYTFTLLSLPLQTSVILILLVNRLTYFNLCQGATVTHSVVGLTMKYHAAKVCITCLLFVIASGRHSPRKIWVGRCPPLTACFTTFLLLGFLLLCYSLVMM